MGGGDVCSYVEVDLLWRQSRNCCSWGLGARNHVGRVNLENWALVPCGGGLESWCVGGGVWVVVVDVGVLGLMLVWVG